jgi:L-asparaginase II
MRARPDLVGGPDGADCELMRLRPGWLAKGGAEGLFCAAAPAGLGVVVKSEDGATRPHRPALARFLEPLGVELPWAVVPVENSRGDEVGRIRVVA